MLHTHLQHQNNTIIKTHAMIKTQEDFFIKIFTSPFIARLRKGCSKFACERELETEHNWNILTPKLWPSALCLSRSPGLLNRSPGVHSAGWWLSLLHLISNFFGPQTTSGFPRAPSAGCGFPYHISSISLSNSTWTRTQLYSICSIRRPYITFKLPRGDMDTPPRHRNFFQYLAIGMCHFRSLWNGLCDRHQAEITVMQFRGHSLPVRQSMRV